MNRRQPTESLDDKIMGDLATIAVVEYLRHRGFAAVAYDQIRTDNFKLPDPGWDVLVSPRDLGLGTWAKQVQNGKIGHNDIPKFAITISVKSSRLPRNDSIEDALNTRDFKILNTHDNNISMDLTSQIETQVYFDYQQSQLNNLALNHEFISNAKHDLEKCETICNQLQISERYQPCILTRWNYSKSIEENTNKRIEQNIPAHWTSFGKSMWYAPLREGKSFKKIHELFT